MIDNSYNYRLDNDARNFIFKQPRRVRQYTTLPNLEKEINLRSAGSTIEFKSNKIGEERKPPVFHQHSQTTQINQSSQNSQPIQYSQYSQYRQNPNAINLLNTEGSVNQVNYLAGENNYSRENNNINIIGDDNLCEDSSKYKSETEKVRPSSQENNSSNQRINFRWEKIGNQELMNQQHKERYVIQNQTQPQPQPQPQIQMLNQNVQSGNDKQYRSNTYDRKPIQAQAEKDLGSSNIIFVGQPVEQSLQGESVGQINYRQYPINYQYRWIERPTLFYPQPQQNEVMGECLECSQNHHIYQYQRPIQYQQRIDDTRFINYRQRPVLNLEEKKEVLFEPSDERYGLLTYSQRPIRIEQPIEVNAEILRPDYNHNILLRKELRVKDNCMVPLYKSKTEINRNKKKVEKTEEETAKETITKETIKETTTQVPQEQKDFVFKVTIKPEPKKEEEIPQEKVDYILRGKIRPAPEPLISKQDNFYISKLNEEPFLEEPFTTFKPRKIEEKIVAEVNRNIDNNYYPKDEPQKICKSCIEKINNYTKEEPQNICKSCIKKIHNYPKDNYKAPKSKEIFKSVNYSKKEIKKENYNFNNNYNQDEDVDEDNIRYLRSIRGAKKDIKPQVTRNDEYKYKYENEEKYYQSKVDERNNYINIEKNNEEEDYYNKNEDKEKTSPKESEYKKVSQYNINNYEDEERKEYIRKEREQEYVPKKKETYKSKNEEYQSKDYSKDTNQFRQIFRKYKCRCTKEKIDYKNDYLQEEDKKKETFKTVGDGTEIENYQFSTYDNVKDPKHKKDMTIHHQRGQILEGGNQEKRNNSNTDTSYKNVKNGKKDGNYEDDDNDYVIIVKNIKQEKNIMEDYKK